MGFGILLVHAAPKFEPPLGHREGKGDKGADGDEGDGGVGHAVEPPQDAAHHDDFDQGGEDVEQHEGEQKLDALHAAFDGTRQAAGAPFEMEAQRQFVQMFEDAQRHHADGAFGDLGEYRIAQLAKGHRGAAQDAIGDQKGNRHHDHGGLIGAQYIDRLLVENRYIDVGDLGQH